MSAPIGTTPWNHAGDPVGSTTDRGKIDSTSTALHETGWLGVSGKGLGGDIRALADSWADAERRAPGGHR